MNRIRQICRCLAGLPRRASALLASAAAAPAMLAAARTAHAAYPQERSDAVRGCRGLTVPKRRHSMGWTAALPSTATIWR